MTTPGMRPDDVSIERVRTEDVLGLLCGVPVGLDVAVKGLPWQRCLRVVGGPFGLS